MTTPATIFPEIRWAQRSNAEDASKNLIWLTVVVTGLIESDVKVTETTFSFTGKNNDRNYKVEFELFDNIIADETKTFKTQQGVLVELKKQKKQEEYWPRLTKDSKRKPYIKTDFDKWVDEDEQNPQEENPMAGLGGGMPDLGAMGGMGGGEGMDFASLLGGAGGPGGFDMSKLGDMSQFKDLAGGSEDAEEENDETESKLGEAQE
ncbi:Hsp90 cochaperone [Starmerella bacillaris]|uniref:Hsp90 cochaperone n=1 Tax=Starmerella bacillaris TaxID=1247836 RepID=A0AAV5RER7_STABA|nr:Hsp90 cochaperone [Starmerella bacillaris]